MRLVPLVVLCLCSTPFLSADEPAAVKAAVPDRVALEKEFSEKMSGAVLVGRFTVDGKEDQAREERYELDKTAKLDGDDWIITARIKYGKYDVSVPIKLQVFWADDTPVISLTDLEIPALGTFTARVMIYGDRYVGTWQHGKVGGHMFGRVERAKPAEENGQPAKTE